MKKSILFSSAALLTVLLFMSCGKGKTIYNAHFWTSKDTSEVRLSLFIDDEYKGELPYLEQEPGCGSENTLSFPVEEGKHSIVAKNVQGVIKSSGTARIRNNARRTSLSSSGGMGGQDIYLNDDCLIVKIYY